MDRLLRPVSQQLLRSRPRYPFTIPPPVYAKRLYSMGHTVPPVRDLLLIDWTFLEQLTDYDGLIAERSISLH